MTKADPTNVRGRCETHTRDLQFGHMISVDLDEDAVEPIEGILIAVSGCEIPPNSRGFATGGFDGPGSWATTRSSGTEQCI